MGVKLPTLTSNAIFLIVHNEVTMVVMMTGKPNKYMDLNASGVGWSVEWRKNTFVHVAQVKIVL